MVEMEYKRLHDANENNEIQSEDALATSKRLSALTKSFSHGAEGQNFLLRHVESQVLLSEKSQSEGEKKELLTTAFSLLNFLHDNKDRKRLAEDILLRAGTSFGLPLLVCLEDTSKSRPTAGIISSLTKSATDIPDPMMSESDGTSKLSSQKL